MLWLAIEHFGMNRIYDMSNERQISAYGYILTVLNGLTDIEVLDRT